MLNLELQSRGVRTDPKRWDHPNRGGRTESFVLGPCVRIQSRKVYIRKQSLKNNKTRTTEKYDFKRQMKNKAKRRGHICKPSTCKADAGE